MASVPMSQTLREQIADNYKKQLYRTLRKEYNVQKAIDSIIPMLTDDFDYKKAIQMNKEYIELAKKLNTKYPSRSSYHKSFPDLIFSTTTKLGLVCNPNRPIDDNLTYIHDWQFPYDVTPHGESEKETRSNQYVDGDIGVKIEDLEPFYMPYSTDLEYTSWRSNDYAPYSHNALVITDPQLCALFSPIGEIEQKVEASLKTFTAWLDGVTTLKKFLDEISGGLNLVPEEYKQRLTAKPKKAKPSKLPDNAIPESLKNSLNEVILENKLLGD